MFFLLLRVVCTASNSAVDLLCFLTTAAQTNVISLAEFNKRQDVLEKHLLLVCDLRSSLETKKEL